MKFEIKNRWNGSVIFECEAVSIRAAVELAMEKRVSLRAADLRAADLRAADLRDADLRDADLRDADLRDADLRAADLRAADLRDADLRDAKEDFLTKLGKLPEESVGLYKAVVDGKIDGSCYTGECACFCGTIANSKGIKADDLTQFGIEIDSDSPVERWFMGIRRWDTPESNPVSAVTKEWIEEFMREREIQIPTRTVSWSWS